MTTIRGQRVDTAPGIVLYRATCPFSDETGRTYEAGTCYTPMWAGSEAGSEYQTVCIAGQLVTVRHG